MRMDRDLGFAWAAGILVICWVHVRYYGAMEDIPMFGTIPTTWTLVLAFVIWCSVFAWLRRRRLKKLEESK